MSKKEYKEVKGNLKSKVKSYKERLKVLGEKELYATKIKEVLENEIQEIRNNYKEELDKSKLFGARRLFVGVQELIERCKIERKIIEKNRKLSENLNLVNSNKVSFLEGRKIRANAKDLKKIVEMGKEKTRGLDNCNSALGNIFDYVEQEIKLIESYMSYVLYGRQDETIPQKLDAIGKDLSKLLNAQKEYEEQVKLTGGKILVESKAFKNKM